MSAVKSVVFQVSNPTFFHVHFYVWWRYILWVYLLTKYIVFVTTFKKNVTLQKTFFKEYKNTQLQFSNWAWLRAILATIMDTTTASACHTLPRLKVYYVYSNNDNMHPDHYKQLIPSRNEIKKKKPCQLCQKQEVQTYDGCLESDKGVFTTERKRILSCFAQSYEKINRKSIVSIIIGSH